VRRDEDGVDHQQPLRADGTPKAFWYDPDYPGHIMHNRGDGMAETICVGHGH